MTATGSMSVRASTRRAWARTMAFALAATFAAVPALS